MKLTENETKAVVVFTASGVVAPAVLVEAGYSANSAAATFGSLTKKGVITPIGDKVPYTQWSMTVPKDGPAEVAQSTPAQTEAVSFTADDAKAYAAKRGDHRGWPTVASMTTAEIAKVIAGAKTKRGAVNKMAVVAHGNHDAAQA